MREVSVLRNFCKNVSGNWETVFDFSLKGLVDQKGLNDFYNWNRSFETRQFMEKTLRPDMVEGFVYVEKHRNRLFVIVKIFTEFMGDFSQ